MKTELWQGCRMMRTYFFMLAVSVKEGMRVMHSEKQFNIKELDLFLCILSNLPKGCLAKTFQRCWGTWSPQGFLANILLF